MRGHIYSCFWLGAGAGLLVGIFVGVGIMMMPGRDRAPFPAITMGRDAK
jgi:uncharacterized membrane-anchored protein YhcB (DUF1043 family)